ncbi:MAG: macro domain-containing protein [Myxococcales bacterium]|nr:macro domain-containing protein [Myxococcales bacterium]
MFPDRTILVDHHAPLCNAWRESFGDYDNVEVLQGDFFSRDADAMVSPANSFGIMDGGLDLAIRAELGFEIQATVQKVILERHHGEIPVGSAEIVATGHKRWPYLVVAPTMRIPESAAQTTNAFLAFRAILLAVRRFNEQSNAEIRSVVVPGLCTGIGAMDPRRCAAQMRIAFDQIAKPARIPSYAAIHETHRVLRSAG